MKQEGEWKGGLGNRKAGEGKEGKVGGHRVRRFNIDIASTCCILGPVKSVCTYVSTCGLNSKMYLPP